MKTDKNRVFVYGTSLIFFILSAISSAIIFYMVENNGIYPSGDDTWYHIYRAHSVYKNLIKGVLYQPLDAYWYNGVENFRYWPPLTAYIMGIFDYVCDGNIYNGYLIFIGFVNLSGAVAWNYIGIKKNRPILCGMIGMIWFFMPNNLYAMFVEGNLPRTMIMSILPLYLFFANEMIHKKTIKNITGTVLSMVFIIMCHFGYAGMIGISMIIFVTVDFIVNRKGNSGRVYIILCFFISVMLCGLYIVPSLHGGMSESSSSQIMNTFFQPLIASINPFIRMTDGIQGHFYFGAAAAIIACIGVFSGRRSLPWFISSIVILLMTTNYSYSALKSIPGSGFLWMLRFISIALCFIMIGMVYWVSLKKIFIVLAIAVLIVDIIPSLPLLYGNETGISPEARLDKFGKETLLESGKSVTKQRLALIDGSTLGSEAAFYVADYKNPVPYAFGAGWTSAVTARNIVMLNESAESGRYMYLFDRCKELGCDTVVVQITRLKNGNNDINRLTACAKESGYDNKKQENGYILFHNDNITGKYGTVNEYQYIGIGSSSPTLSLIYPGIKETSDTNIDDYSFTELSKYKTVYLDGFTYKNVDNAEALIKKLSDSGVKICIFTDVMPINPHTREKTFLGVQCQNITFTNGYPDLTFKNERYVCSLFPDGYTTWNTVYLNGLSETYGKIIDNGKTLSFAGTVYNKNITVIGISLFYYESITGDKQAYQILSSMVDIGENSLPKRTIVNLSISYQNDKMSIISKKDQINTGISFHDIFLSGQKIENDNNLLIVNSGETDIIYAYPYLKEGIVLTLIGIICFVSLLILNCSYFIHHKKGIL